MIRKDDATLVLPARTAGLFTKLLGHGPVPSRHHQEHPTGSIPPYPGPQSPGGSLPSTSKQHRTGQREPQTPPDAPSCLSAFHFICLELVQGRQPTASTLLPSSSRSHLVGNFPVTLSPTNGTQIQSPRAGLRVSGTFSRM